MFINYIMDFSNAKNGLSGVYSTFKRSGLDLKNVKEQLNAQGGYQQNKQILHPHFFPIWGHGVGSYQADLLFLPSYNKVNTVLCCINVNTRYAYAYEIRSKSGTYEALKQFIEDSNHDNRECHFLQTDSGTEFKNYKVQELMNKNNVKYNYVDPEDHAGQGKVERFNQTLRRLVTLYISSNNNNDWVSVLKDLVYNYNHRYHRALGCTPEEANEATQIEKQMEQYNNAKNDFDKYKIGMTVRILKNKKRFDKGRQKYSTSVYTIQNIQGHLIEVNGDWYKHYQLQLVTGSSNADDFEKEQTKQKKENKILRALAKEGLIKTGDQVEIKPRGKREKKVDDYIGRTYRRKFGRKYYEGRVIEYEGDGDWIVQYNEEIKDKNILDGKFERVNKNELELYSKK